jgi:hypothetical protein
LDAVDVNCPQNGTSSRVLPWSWDDELVERLVADGRLAQPEEGWLCAP